MPSKIPTPPFRKLRGYAIDPSLSISLSTRQVNDLVYKVKWEELELRAKDKKDEQTPVDNRNDEDELQGSYPVGEYLEIVDYDPASSLFYEPINLDDPHLLAQDGYAPSVSNPQFHQQMVYAVIMTTIKNFEQALGRKILWAANILDPKEATEPEKLNEQTKSAEGKERAQVKFEFVRRLRVYPHALRQANAFYDPLKKALLFGYFSATPVNAQLQLPGATVFTCLSHDIIAHETTHAILDGIHRRYTRATHPDTRAFHEAFADIVALFQHFSFPEVLRHQIAMTRGDLKRQNLLGQLAQQFGQAIGGYGSLRDAIGDFDDAGNWTPNVPDPADYANEMECHKRGAILVGAVFDAFLNIYQARAQKLLRIATGGTGMLPAGDIHPDLVDEMANRAARTASDVLRTCIRALDYCPPMDLTYGDYLRALITADFDMMAEDLQGYRVAFVEAFQKRGISAAGVKSMAVEDLLYPLYRSTLNKTEEEKLGTLLRDLKNRIGYLTDRKDLFDLTKELIDKENGLLHHLESNFIWGDDAALFSELTGLLFPGDRAPTEKQGLEFGYSTKKTASFVVGNLSLANRVTPDGNIVNHIIITLVQKRGVRFMGDVKDATVDEDGYFVPDDPKSKPWGDKHIIFGGGCTLVFDLDSLRLRYAIKKDIDDKDRMIRQFQFEKGFLDQDSGTYFASKTMNALAGPFAFMHSHSAENGDRHGH